jgi:hypothetical protein
MTRALRILFLGRLLREKLLLIGFILIGLAWWGSAFAQRAGQFWREQRATSARLNSQAIWINNRGTIEENAQRTAASLDPTRTLNATQLAAAVNRIASDAGLQSNISGGQPSTERSGQFSIHSVTYDLRGVDWEKLKQFYQSLQQRAPYIAIDSFTIIAAPANPNQLSVRLRVVSFEPIR